jgi:endonuclease/exonuclease/phosphatase family metal-dependent hydrolase
LRKAKLRVATYNILNGGADRGPQILSALKRLSTDILCLIEADNGALVRSIASELKMNFVIGKGEKHAVAILSRFPIASSINYSGFLGNPRNMLQAAVLSPAPPAPTPAGKGFSRDLRSADEDVGATGIPVIAVHLKGGAFLSDEAYRLEEIDLLLKILEPYRNNNIPHVLAGDFNSNSPIQQINPEKCTPRTRLAFDQNGGIIPRDVLLKLFNAGYRDSLAQAIGAVEAGKIPSFTSKFPGQRLDYILTWRLKTHIAGVDASAGAASDHFPVYAEMNPSAAGALAG